MVIDELNKEVRKIKKRISIIVGTVYFLSILLLLVATKRLEIAFIVSAFLAMFICGVCSLLMFNSLIKYKDIILEGVILKSTTTKKGMITYTILFLSVVALSLITTTTGISSLIFPVVSGSLIGLLLLIVNAARDTSIDSSSSDSNHDEYKFADPTEPYKPSDWRYSDPNCPGNPIYPNNKFFT